MPRVNRDLQRRLAARRERDRRPPPERRYNFQATPPVDADAEPTDELATDGAAQTSAVTESTTSTAPTGRRGRVVQTQRAAPRPFADYSAEYAYVAADLRRLGVVVAVILVLLFVLYLVLPR
jgi:hypothetical protein